MNKSRSGLKSLVNGVGTAAKTPRTVLFDNGIIQFGRLSQPLRLRKEFLVYLDRAFFFFGYFIDVPDGINRTNCFAQGTRYALFRIDIEHRLTFMDAVNRAHIDTGTVLDTDAR
jgi:hypothetical protein